MPTPTEILASSTEIANRYWPLAAAVHLFALLVGLALWRGWRPHWRTVGWLSILPLVSVAGMAVAVHNPVNAIAFGALALALAMALRFGRRPAPPSAWAFLAGCAMIGFGLFYPHFLLDRSPLAYLYAAPTGLLPCPTLSLLVGLTLASGGLAAGAWPWIVAAAGALYGALGVMWLGVTLDIVLLGGAGALVLATVARHRASFDARVPGTA